jgi:hypothetical protein
LIDTLRQHVALPQHGQECASMSVSA